MGGCSVKKLFLAGLALCAGWVSVVQAQVAVNVSGSNVSVQTGGSNGSMASNTTATLGPDVEMEGVAVINEEVFIDGVKVPHGKTSYFSKKSGKFYTIRWDKNGNIAVQEK